MIHLRRQKNHKCTLSQECYAPPPVAEQVRAHVQPVPAAVVSATAIGATPTFALDVFSGPKQAVGNPVAHAQASAGGQALPGKVLDLLHGIAEQQAVAQIAGNACAKRGAAAVAE